jgi:hypothetical protein
MAALHTTRAATRAPRRALPRRRALCNRVVPDPTGITLEAGLLQVVRGLRTAEVESRQSGPQSLGLDPCTVTVTFNITADGTNRNQIVLDASVKPTIGVAPAGSGVQATSENTLIRGFHIDHRLCWPESLPLADAGTAEMGGNRTLILTEFDEPPTAKCGTVFPSFVPTWR